MRVFFSNGGRALLSPKRLGRSAQTSGFEKRGLQAAAETRIGETGCGIGTTEDIGPQAKLYRFFFSYSSL